MPQFIQVNPDPSQLNSSDSGKVLVVAVGVLFVVLSGWARSIWIASGTETVFSTLDGFEQRLDDIQGVIHANNGYREDVLGRHAQDYTTALRNIRSRGDELRAQQYRFGNDARGLNFPRNVILRYRQMNDICELDRTIADIQAQLQAHIQEAKAKQYAANNTPQFCA